MHCLSFYFRHWVYKMNNNIIEVKNLTVRYGDLTVLENVTFNIERGKIFLIVGGSGCGKSTLLRQLIGLEYPTEGSVFIDGDDFTNANLEEKTEIMKKFGVLFQSTGLFASMTIEENIDLVLETYTDLSTEDREKLIAIKLAAVGLSGFQHYLPNEISGGMKKRAALARAMALDPALLFFDEPSSGLDPLTSASLDKLIKELNNGLNASMIIVTHDLDSILNIADHIIMLDSSVKGILAQGTPDELKNYKQNELVYNFFNRIS